jgi:hypothetical protein
MNLSPDFVRPLGAAENHLLQILLTRFDLTRSGRGTNLSLRFDEETPAIWTRHGKRHVQSSIPGFDRKWRGLQEKLDAVLLDRRQSFYSYNEPEFPLRYGSGGVLPIVRMDKREFFCLFYRDIYPIGWNIANGGTDSRAELLYPLTTVEREFCEELLVLKPPPPGSRHDGRRYVFEWGAGRFEDRAEYAMARKLWTYLFPQWDVESFQQLMLPLQWLEGPDSIKVQMGSGQPVSTTGCFLNVNAEDFGIEVDRVAKIWVPEDALLLDGEIMDLKVLDRPVGLFDVDKTLSQFAADDESAFFPEFFFFGGKRHDGNEFVEAIDKRLTPSLGELRTPEEVRYFTSLRNKKFKLCPVTRTLLRRYSDCMNEQHVPADPVGGPVVATRAPLPDGFDVFISFADEDEALARQIFDYVKRTKGRSPFLYKEYMVDRWGRLLADALDSATCLIVVGTDVDRLKNGWLEHEWFAFLNAVNIKRKPRGKFIPFVQGIDERRVPIFWLAHQIIHGDDVARGLRELGEVLDSV